MMALQAAVDPFDGVTFALSDDALLNVGVDLLVHEVLQFGQVIIQKGRQSKERVYNLELREEDRESVVVYRKDQTSKSYPEAVSS